MLKTQYNRRKPDFLLILLALVGSAMLATLTVHYHLLDNAKSVDQDHPYSQQRF